MIFEEPLCRITMVWRIIQIDQGISHSSIDRSISGLDRRNPDLSIQEWVGHGEGDCSHIRSKDPCR
jgi:hypothetical protein